jgi:hypothetical protein
MTTYSRVTVVPSDVVCTIDGVSMVGVDMSSLPANLHAMQWYGTWGEEEYMDRPTRRMEPNVRITSLDSYAPVFASYQQLLEAKQRAEEEASTEQTIIEV